MYRISLENITLFDFGRETWTKYYLEDYSQFYLSGSAFSDRSIKTENNKNRPLGLSKR